MEETAETAETATSATSDGSRQTPLTRALATIRTLRQRIEEQEGSRPVAVVGVGLRLPGGIDNLDGYWEALAAGRDLVRPIPQNRKEPFTAEWEKLPQRGCFLDEVLDFDAAFFGISPREARHLDPQQRLLLEVAWEAMENAGLPADRLSGTQTGMYLGIMWQDYRDWLVGEPDAYWTTGNGHNFAAGRIAHALGLNGPAMAVDTACSSSLVAVHLAAQALRRGDCDVAFAAGTNLILSPRSMRLVQETRSLAPDGRCKAFDARANGFVRGEGCGVVVLKRLDHALRDGDRVHAVIHGTAVNQDGRSGGFTAPNVLSQVALIEKALAESGLAPSDIGYIEAHGTGTALGDPIEMEALATALGRANGGAPLAVGAAKSNFGHLEAAAGVAGLVKAMLCLRHRKAPPVVHFRTLNPRVDLSGTGMTVPGELTDWAPGSGRYAGVSSFGMSGTNAHVILGPPEDTRRDGGSRTSGPQTGGLPTGGPQTGGLPTGGPQSGGPRVEGFEISAKTPEALRALAGRYADRVSALGPESYAAFAHSAGAGRTGHAFRARLTCGDVESAAGALRALAAGEPRADVTLAEGTAPEAGRLGDALPRDVIDLPAYPWQRTRHAPEILPTGPVTPAAPDGEAAPADTEQRPDAEQRPLPTVHRTVWQTAEPSGAAPPDSLILAGDDQELLETLVREATARGVRGTLLTPVPPGRADGWTTAELPSDARAWQRFWADREDREPEALLLVMKGDRLPVGPDTDAPGDAGSGTADSSVDPLADGASLCAAVTAAVCAAARYGGRAFVLTRATVRTSDGDRTVCTGHGLLHGLAPVLGLELGTAWGGIIDLPLAPGDDDTGALIDFVAGQFASEVPGAEDLAAIRDGRVLVARLTEAAGHTAELTVREDATYVVTGGLGAVGRELVADLVRRGARNLLLIGRRPEGELGPEAAALLANLARNTDRTVYRGGGCDTPEALERACEALDGLPPVRGVLHAAGTLRRSPVGETGAEEFAAALSGKAAGAWWLHLAGCAWPLDFFVLTSSVSALWGTEGCAAYSAANGALDTLAAHRRSLGLPAVSIAYGPWALGGEGMADAALRERSARMGVGTLDADTGRAALTMRAPGADGRLVVCPLDLPRLRQVMAGLRRRGLFGTHDTTSAAPAVGAHSFLDGLTPGERPAAARATVTRLLAAQLSHADSTAVRENVGFYDLGLDSIMAVDLTARLSEVFGTTVQVADVFDHPTVAELAAFLLSRGDGALTPSGGRHVPAAGAPDSPARGSVAAPGVSARTTAIEGTFTAAEGTPTPAEDAPTAAGTTAEPIAIVGMAGRFPGADSVEELWELLRDGRDGVTAVPAGRWDTSAVRPGTVTTDQGGFLSDIDRFDAGFFAVPAREAENLDPQQRLLLESAWHAMEDGGIDPSSLRDSRTAVFVGVSYADYARLLTQDGLEGVDAYYSTGTALNAAAGRIAYTLGLNGPAVAVDTACSSSLVALHLAVGSLRSGESDTVLAGGVNIMLDPASWAAVSQAHMLSPDGRCRTFSADANGFVRSEGCGVVVLKRLGDARRDGDRVLAVIRGSAVNQDGASSGLTAPNGRAQEGMLEAALTQAGVAGSEISYLEAHGTGTALGDPVELGAAWRVLGPGRKPGRPLHVGSVKSNIGHCESAAGMAALFKTVLALRHDLIPANLHFREPNPHVDWSGMNVRVVDTATAWRRGDGPRVAGVSGFGFTGTNAHLVIADAPAETPAPPQVTAPAETPAPSQVTAPAGTPAPSQITAPAETPVPSQVTVPAVPAADAESRPKPPSRLVPLSAPDPEGLERLTSAWARRLENATEEELDSLAATAGAGRAHFPYRRALLGATSQQLSAQLDTPAAAAPRAPRVAFLFTGQGSQYYGMGRELYENEPVFRETFDTCDRILTPLLGASLADLLYYGEDRTAVNETRVTQPALVTLEMALVSLWASWSVRPAVVMGHSVGEISAAMAAGVMDLPTGLRLIAHRARLMQGTERGAMLAVVATEADVRSWTADTGLDIAAVNGPESVVVSGAPDVVDGLAARLKTRGVRARKLSVSHAFHSSLLDPALTEFDAVLAPLEFTEPALPIVSNVTGRPATPGEYDAGYWRRHARRPVRFLDGARQLALLGVDICLEIGPDHTLVNLVKGAGLAETPGLASSLRRGTGDRAALLAAARQLYLGGQNLDWEQVTPRRSGPRATAPRYPFARTRYWTGAGGRAVATGPRPATRGPAWGTEIHSPALGGRVWATERSTAYPAHLTDHRLYGTVSVPGASQTATVLSALGSGGIPVLLEDLHFPRALVLRDGERYELQIVAESPERGTRGVSVHSLLDGETGRWQEHLVARVADAGTRSDTGRHTATPPDPAAFMKSADRHLSGAGFYGHLRSLGYHLGPSFRWIGDAYLRGDEALIRFVEPAEMNESPDGYEIHPGLLDSCLQSAVAFAVTGERVTEEDGLAIPFSIARLSFPRRPVPGRELWGHVRAVREAGPDDGLLQVKSADLHMFDSSGATVLAVDDFRFRRAPRDLLQRSLREGVLHTYGLTWTVRKPATASVTGPVRSRRIALLGAGTALGRAVREACAAHGHEVEPVPDGGTGTVRADLVVDARFVPGREGGAGPADALAAARELTGTLHAVDRTIPYAVLGDLGDDRAEGGAGAPVREAVWGLLASLEAEQTDRRLLRVGLTADWDPSVLTEALIRSLDEGVPEPRLAIGRDEVRVARLVPYDADRGPEPAAYPNGAAALITGGLGALGLSTAGFLARRGFTAITLMARSAPDAAARAVIDELTARGVRMSVVRGDVTDPGTCRAVVARAGQEVPLRAVLHLAGVTDDQAFDRLGAGSFDAVFAAKAHGAANLAEALAGHELDAFVLFSSASAVLGNAGQVNYAAANGYLDGLAMTLRAAGTPATSVNWGPWAPDARGGMAASAAVERAMERRGLRSLTDEEAEAVIRAVLSGGPGGRLVAVAMDRERYAGQLADHPRAALVRSLAGRQARPTGAEPARGRLTEQLTGLDRDDLVDRLRQAVRALAGEVLGDETAIVDDLGFTETGLDSIMVIDLRTRLSHVLGADLPATVALDHPTVDQLVSYVTELLFPAEPSGPAGPPAGPAERTTTAPPTAPAAPADSGTPLEDLSFEELVQAVQADVVTEK
ncbi:SDR family NAD(P)-dependent oxidoreductase [Streptomyces sp. NPDC051662]|uniref:SDR family NAD(P)-dependent oxidoreductase n=1 Tax=Streptomyces sp. NPDC051662 TaxID=3154750 RepID=UPI003435636B